MKISVPGAAGHGNLQYLGHEDVSFFDDGKRRMKIPKLFGLEDTKFPHHEFGSIYDEYTWNPNGPCFGGALGNDNSGKLGSSQAGSRSNDIVTSYDFAGRGVLNFCPPQKGGIGEPWVRVGSNNFSVFDHVLVLQCHLFFF